MNEVLLYAVLRHPGLRHHWVIYVCVCTREHMHSCSHTFVYRFWRETGTGKEVVFQSLCFKQTYKVDTLHVRHVLKNILFCVIQHKTLFTVLSSNIFFKIDSRTLKIHQPRKVITVVHFLFNVNHCKELLFKYVFFSLGLKRHKNKCGFVISK